MKTELMLTVPDNFVEQVCSAHNNRLSLNLGGLKIKYEINEARDGGGAIYIFEHYICGIPSDDCTIKDVWEAIFDFCNGIDIKTLLGLCSCGCDLTPLFLERLYKLHIKQVTDWKYYPNFDIQDEIYLQLLDTLGWLEHGGSVYGSWLSDAGIEFVNTFITKEQQKEFILELAEKGELTTELQQMCLDAIK